MSSDPSPQGGPTADQQSGGSRRESAQAGPAGPRRRRLVTFSVAAAVLLAGGGTYLGQSLLGGSDASQSSAGATEETGPAPEPLRLDGQGLGARSEGGSQDSYRLAGKSPEGPRTAPVYRAGKVEKSSVTKLARALGLTVPPRQQNSTWLVREGTDAMGPVLRVSGTEEGQRGQWSFSKYSTGADPRCGKVPQPDKSPTCPSLLERGEVNKPSSMGSSPNAEEGSAEATDGPKPISQKRAKEAAAPVLRSLGLSHARLDATATTGALRTVKARPQLNGLPVQGWDTSVSVDTSGEVVRGHGALARLTKSSDYPVLGAEETLAQLNENRPARGEIQCLKEPCDSGDDAGPVKVSNPVFQLAAHSSEGKRVLVPSWSFELGEGRAVSYPALEPRHLEPAKEPSKGAGPGGGADPSEPDSPGSTPQPAPGGNGVESYDPEDRTLTVRFWGGVCSDYSATAKETADTVRITLHAQAREPGEVCVKIAKSMSVKVTLEKPVGDRKVVDEDGKRLEEH